MFFYKFLSVLLRKNGKISFIVKLDKNSTILDVGCGNNSPYRIKKLLPDCHYTGLDIDNYNQSKPNLANSYILTTPSEFASEIRNFNNTFDAVISSHNLEHCDDRDAVLLAMLNSLKVGGVIYMSFPCEKSVGFPSRTGTLNYYDDETHKFSPPKFKEILQILNKSGFEIQYASKNYSPLILRTIGFMLEPISKVKNKLMRGTWEYYGFETIIIAKK